MNITVFGASGGIGGHVTALAARRGHHVRAVYRQAPAAPPAGAETVIAPDVFHPGFALRGFICAGTAAPRSAPCSPHGLPARQPAASGGRPAKAVARRPFGMDLLSFPELRMRISPRRHSAT